MCVCDTMGGIRFCGFGCPSEDPFVLARNPHKGVARESSHETAKRRWVKLPGTVGWREQLREDQSRDESRVERRKVNRYQKATAKTC